jgi:hypothetical protein
VGPRTGLDVVERKILPLPGIIIILVIIIIIIIIIIISVRLE